MSKFAKGITHKNAKTKTKKRKYFFFSFHQVSTHYPFFISCLTVELLAVTVFEISSFLSKFAKGNNLKKCFSPSCLLIILYKLTKFEAPSLTIFEISSFLCPNLQRAITPKNIMIFF